jgi:hypothetical protein
VENCGILRKTWKLAKKTLRLQAFEIINLSLILKAF